MNQNLDLEYASSLGIVKLWLICTIDVDVFGRNMPTKVRIGPFITITRDLTHASRKRPLVSSLRYEIEDCH